MIWVGILLLFVCTLLLQEGLAGRDIYAHEIPKPKVVSRFWWHIHSSPWLPSWLHPAPSTPMTPSMSVPAVVKQQPPHSGSSSPAWKPPTQQFGNVWWMSYIVESHNGDFSHLIMLVRIVVLNCPFACDALYAPRPQTNCGSSSKSSKA